MDRSPTPLVEIDQVTKSFGEKVALKDLSFSVPAGQLCGLLGPNGAGKTTLFRLLMGILKTTEGKLLIDSLDAFDDRVEDLLVAATRLHLTCLQRLRRLM